MNEQSCEPRLVNFDLVSEYIEEGNEKHELGTY